jgi:hypothetical protein
MPTPLVALFALLVLGCACGPKSVPRPYATPQLEAVLSDVRRTNAAARSFSAESTMDYWVGRDRVRGTVLVMGQKGAYVRFNALNPTGDNVAADLACNGADFAYIDYNNDCQLTGPCTRDSIAQLLRVSLDPDDFLLLVLGSTPLIAYGEGSIEWDEKSGTERVRLVSPDKRLTQTIQLRRSGELWEVVSSIVHDADGAIEWKLQNRDFSTQQGPDGAAFRLPGRTMFEQPKAKADLLVRWGERTVNPEIPPDRFEMDIPAGLRWCGD